MNVGRKLMLIVAASVILVTIPAATGIYFYAQQQLLSNESENLLKKTNALITANAQAFKEDELRLQSLSSLLKKTLEAAPQAGEEAAFDHLVQQGPDGAWRSKHKSIIGNMQAGLFLPPDAPLDAAQKILHLRSKQLFDIFGSSITSPTGNIWLVTLGKTEVIYDNAFPNFVSLMPANTDYTQTPWMTLGDPATNPERGLRWTPPLYDPPSKLWLVSAVLPVDVNGRWIGTIGSDFNLEKVLSALTQHNRPYAGEQYFLLDAQNNFIQAGPWQKELESKAGDFKPDLRNESDLVKLLGLTETNKQPHLSQRQVLLQGRKYIATGMTIPKVGWRYCRLVPTDEILAPLRRLFFSIIAVVLASGLLIGFFINAAVKKNIVNRLQVMANAVRRYSLGDLDARANLFGDDEIATTSHEFDAMAEQMKATLDAIPDIMFELGLDGRYYAVHTTDEELLAASPSELIGKTVAQVLPPHSAAIVMAALQEAHEKGSSRGRQFELITPQAELWFELSVAKKLSTDVQNPRFIVLSRNITERKLAEEEIQNLAFFDTLTGLPNRRLLLDRLKHALAASARSGKDGALLFVDLDHFKTLNDTLGHAIGDLLLQQVAERLVASLRDSDTLARVARLGGDEFVVVLEDLNEHNIEAAAQAEIVSKKILSALNQPYQLGKHTCHSTASIGVALFSDHSLSQQELLKHADIAMYQAKKFGRNTLRFFDPQMQANIDVRASLESELRLALDKGQFQLHYQVQVDSQHRPIGAEALIRWFHPLHNVVSPLHFIPLAEETNLIQSIGLWVLESACAQLKAWQQNEFTRNIMLSVNVSAKQFRQENFVPEVLATVKRHAINPMLLKLELTESMLLDDLAGTTSTMNALQEIGVLFSLDDFGTGYSSLQYLKQLPLNQLKIDQSFIRDIVTDSNDKSIVRTIIAMAHSMNLGVIAEGVETEEQRQLLMELGCTHFQGYLFSKPLAIIQFEALLKKL